MARVPGNITTCFPLYDASLITPPFALFCRVYMILVFLLIVVSDIALIRHRKHQYLAKRSPLLVLTHSLAIPLDLLVGPFSTLYPDKIKCDLFYWASLMIVPTASKSTEPTA